MQVTISLENLDLVLLRRQKCHLVETKTVTGDYENAIEGMLNLLDHIQDYIVATGQASEAEVFGPRDSDGRLDEAAEEILQAEYKARLGE